MLTNLLCVWLFAGVIVITGGFDCHDDPTFNPEEGPLNTYQFNWLGALQYVHVKEGTPHYYWVPRVTLVTKQFALSTARDAAEVPDGYALGHAIFGDYEKDEGECNITMEQLEKGKRCDPAVISIPIADVFLHPEYQREGIRSSLALLKLSSPLKSKYMLPACLPYNDFLRGDGMVTGQLIHVDFASESPRDFVDEEKMVTYLEVLKKELCSLNDVSKNSSRLPESRYICTNGCDIQSGAPTLVHEQTGHWNVIAIAEGGCPCPDPLRFRVPLPPSRHMLLYPYVPWIVSTIAGKSMKSFAENDPFGYILPRSFAHEKRERGWVGHWWVGGIRCFDRGEGAADIYRFYNEVFLIYPEMTETSITYFLEIHAPYSFKIVCVKVGMPYQIRTPMLWGLETEAIKLRIPLFPSKKFYRIIVDAWCNNGTDSMLDTEGEKDDDIKEGKDEDSMEYLDTDVEYIYDEPEARGWYKGKEKSYKGK